MKAEDKYKAQLQELGIWRDAFEPEVHTLCMMERELRRTQKEFKTLDPDAQRLGKCYELILQLRRDILSHRDALGLTPKSFKRLRGDDFGEGGPVEVTLSEEALRNGE